VSAIAIPVKFFYSSGMTGLLTPETEEKIEQVMRAWGYDSPDDAVLDALRVHYEQRYLEWEKQEVQKGLDSEGGIPASQVFEELRERAARRHQ